MKTICFIIFCLLLHPSVGQVNNNLNSEFFSLKDSGIKGLETFMLHLQNDTSGNHILKSIVIDTILLINMDTLHIESLDFKQFSIKGTIKIQQDTVWHYEIHISTYHQKDFLFRVWKNINKVDVKMSYEDGKLKNYFGYAEDVYIVIPAFSAAKIEIHKLTGELVEDLYHFGLFHSDITFRDVNEIELSDDEILVTVIMTEKKTLIGFYK